MLLRKYEVDIVEEDWGRCLICSRSPRLLWVGCGNVYDQKLFKDGKAPTAGDITWQCFVVAEVSFLKLLSVERGPPHRSFLAIPLSALSSGPRESPAMQVAA